MNILRCSLRAVSCVFLSLILLFSFLTPAIRFLSQSNRFGLFWALMYATPVCGKLQLKQTDSWFKKSYERRRSVFGRLVVISVDFCNSFKSRRVV